MDFFEENDLIYTLKDINNFIEGFQRLTQSRFLLLKRGKILKRKVFRYVSFNNEAIFYFKQPSSPLPKGSASLHRSIVIPVESCLESFSFSLKVILQDHSEFLLFCSNLQDQDLVVLYIKLSSNNMLQQTLDKVCFKAIDNEFLALNNLKTPKYSNGRNLVTPKNVVSRFLFSPTSDDFLELAEESKVQRLPRFDSEEFFNYDLVYHEETFVEIPEIDEGVERNHRNHRNERNERIEMTERTERTERNEWNDRNDRKSKSFDSGMDRLSFKVFNSGNVEEIRDLGVRYLWNYQLDFAKTTFESIKEVDVRSRLYLSEVTFFRLLITGRKSDIQASMLELQSCETTVPQMQDIYLEVFLAELMLFKSIVLIITGQKFKAFISLRSCWKTYKKYETSQILDPDVKARVQLGLGIFLLLLSLAPASICAILRLAGFSSDKARGLSHLQQALNLKESRSAYAGLILALYYVDLDPNPEKASLIVQDLSLSHPGCVLVHWVSSIISWKKNQIDSAIGFLNRALHFCGEDLRKQAAFMKYELGWLYFLRFEWTFARRYFEEILLETLSLSSGLDMMVKKLIIAGCLDNEDEKTLENLIKKTGKKEKKDKKNWLESETTPDRVYLPHKACLITQLVCCLPARHSSITPWLKVIQASALLSSSHSTYDDDFARLSLCFEMRGSTALLPFEVIYFMKQHTKVLPHMLCKIVNAASEVISATDSVVEQCSGKMLQIMAFALNGDTSLALPLLQDLQKLTESLPTWSSYLAPHSLYWCARVLIAEDKKPEAEKLLKKAKKCKKYIFDIKCKIERVLNELI
jgi:tetratricopeptide (TPR) repeat protein